MVKQNEVILQNAKLENVMRYLSEKIKGISGKVIEQTHDDGTVYMYCIQNPRFSYPLNKIEVEYTNTITPKGDMEKSHGYWGSLSAMRFEGMQLQTDTVRITAECNHPIVLSDFDRYWADMLQAFGADAPTKPAPTVEAVKDESKSPKAANPRKGKKKINVPNSKEPKRKWAEVYEFYVTHGYEARRMNAKRFRIEYQIYDPDKLDKPDWIPQDNETLQALLNYGRAGKIPKYDSIK